MSIGADNCQLVQLTVVEKAAPSVEATTETMPVHIMYGLT